MNVTRTHPFCYQRAAPFSRLTLRQSHYSCKFVSLQGQVVLNSVGNANEMLRTAGATKARIKKDKILCARERPIAFGKLRRDIHALMKYATEQKSDCEIKCSM